MPGAGGQPGPSASRGVQTDPAARGAKLREGRTRHNEVRDEVAVKLKKKYGAENVQTEAFSRTSQGKRFTDIKYTNPNTGKTRGLEIKTGSSRYTPRQRPKDAELPFRTRVIRTAR